VEDQWQRRIEVEKIVAAAAHDWPIPLLFPLNSFDFAPGHEDVELP
jgi:hypothetical protein